MASTYWPISFLQTTLLGIRLKLWVLSCIWRAGPCSQQLGHVKVTLPVPGSLVVFQGEWGEGLCELASPSLCRLYLYSAWLFSPLMTAAISPGAFWGCFSKLYFLFWFSLACWGFAETKNKWKQNAQTHWSTGGCWKQEQESWCPRWRFWTQAFQPALFTSWCPDSIW